MVAFSAVLALMTIAGVARATAADHPRARSQDRSEQVTDTGWRFEVPDGRVSAEQLWAETLRAVDCMESAGVIVLGPYADFNGASVRYSTSITPDLDEVERTCNSTLMGMMARFQLDNVPPDEIDPAWSPEEMYDQHAEPATDEAQWFVDLNERIERCLGQRGFDVDPGGDISPNAVLDRASMEDPDLLRECALQAGDG